MKKNGYLINHGAKTITITKAFAMRAADSSTAEYRELTKFHNISSNGKILFVRPIAPPTTEKDDATEDNAAEVEALAEHGEVAKAS